MPEDVEPKEILELISPEEREELKHLILNGQKYFAMAALHQKKRWHLHDIMEAVQLLAEKVNADENPRHP